MVSDAVKPKVILDTDPGGDDCFALLWLQSLAHQKAVEIVAVTTAYGNVNAKLTFAGASKVLKLAGFESIEVGRAMPPKNSHGDDAGHIHGADGMGNLSQTLPESAQTWRTARDSAEILIEALEQFPRAVTIAAVAPLTNLAAAEQKSPGILQRAKEIVIMGGAFQVPGNVTAAAEFNIATDPEAAQVVLNSGANLTIIPLDVTRHVVFTPAMARSVEAAHPNSAISKFVVALCDFMSGTGLQYRETQGVPGFLVHDAATIAYLFYPEVLTFERAQVEVETQGELTKGKTILDRRHRAKVANAWVAIAVDPVNLLAILVEDLKYLTKKPSNRE